MSVGGAWFMSVGTAGLAVVIGGALGEVKAAVVGWADGVAIWTEGLSPLSSLQHFFLRMMHQIAIIPMMAMMDPLENTREIV